MSPSLQRVHFETTWWECPPLGACHAKQSCAVCVLSIAAVSSAPIRCEEPKQGAVNRAILGGDVVLETIFIPPGEFMMGSTPEEKAWATGIEGGAQAGTERESYEGEQPRQMQVKYGYWMGRTEVTVGQFRRFVEESGYVTDAEKPGGHTQCFNPKWTHYNLTTQVTHPWEPMSGKSWRDPTFQFPLRDDFPLCRRLIIMANEAGTDSGWPTCAAACGK